MPYVRQPAVSPSTPHYGAHTGHAQRRLGSARIMLGRLCRHYQPRSVLDVGCADGAWLKASRELGVRTTVGFDTTARTGPGLLDPHITFSQVDFETPIQTDHTFDLAISLGAAARLEPDSACNLVNALTASSDVVLFAAAPAIEPGNAPTDADARPDSFWGRLFAERDFAVFDMFRPAHWHDERVASNYRRGAFLFVRESSDLCERLHEDGIASISDLADMDGAPARADDPVPAAEPATERDDHGRRGQGILNTLGALTGWSRGPKVVDVGWGGSASGGMFTSAELFTSDLGYRD